MYMMYKRLACGPISTDGWLEESLGICTLICPRRSLRRSLHRWTASAKAMMRARRPKSLRRKGMTAKDWMPLDDGTTGTTMIFLWLLEWAFKTLTVSSRHKTHHLPWNLRVIWQAYQNSSEAPQRHSLCYPYRKTSFAGCSMILHCSIAQLPQQKV